MAIGSYQPGFQDEGMLELLAAQRDEAWAQLLVSPVQDLYRVQAKAQVIDRMIQDCRDRIRGLPKSR